MPGSSMPISDFGIITIGPADANRALTAGALTSWGNVGWVARRGGCFVKLTVADVNLESTNLVTLQTRQQLAIQSLSIATQSEQAVLRLFH